MTGATATSGWYVFGVVPSDAAPPRGTYLVERGPVAAVVGEVPLSEFGDESLQANLNDRPWLEEKVWTHETVLQSFVGVAPVVPLRFGAIYRDLDQVRALLAERADLFASTLERLSGHVEVGVKAWFDPARIARPPVSGGRAYLERRRGELASAHKAAAAAAEAHARLSTVAADCVANRPQPRELTGREDTMLLNGAYLVPADDERLADEAGRLADQHAPLGIAYEVTGPWPPYNFARLEDEA